MRAFVSRVASLTGALTCWLLVVGHVLAIGHLVFAIRVGRTVAAFGGGHGVHQGDLLAIPLAGSALACFVAGVALLNDGTRRRAAYAWRD